MRRGYVHLGLKLVVGAVLFGASFCTGVAGAAPCGAPDLLETAPADGTTNVPTNATLSALYAVSAEYSDEDVTLKQVGGMEWVLLGTFNQNEGILSVVPPEGLEPGGRYELNWPRLRGLGTASRGDGAVVRFEAGPRADEAPPDFAGVRSISWDIDREQDECADSVVQRFVFDLGLSPARDDGGRESLMLTVFQTSGPDLSAGGAPQPVHVQLMPEDDRVRVSRAVDDAVGHMCFAAIVRDLTGQVSSSGNEEVCTDTVQPPFFYGCTMRRRSSHELGAVAALAVAFILSRRFLGGRRPGLRSPRFARADRPSRGLPERAPNA